MGEMRYSKSVRVFAPASIANISVGFDCLGAALKPTDNKELGDIAYLEFSEENQLNVKGPFAKQLPNNHQDNIVIRAQSIYERELRRFEKEVHPVKIVLEKRLPVGSGLGSSSSSIVAALVGLNRLYENILDSNLLLSLMGELEGEISGNIHYDNVASCFLGGLQLMTGDQKRPILEIPAFDHWYWVIAYPGIQLKTSEARAILPEKYSLKTCTKQLQLLGSFIHASHIKDEHLAAQAIEDLLAEPYRIKLMPFLNEFKVQAKLKKGLASGISGAGPTMFAIFNEEKKAHEFSLWCQDKYSHESAFVHICQLDKQGAMGQ